VAEKRRTRLKDVQLPARLQPYPGEVIVCAPRGTAVPLDPEIRREGKRTELLNRCIVLEYLSGSGHPSLQSNDIG
jgi:hypothetical protein